MLSLDCNHPDIKEFIQIKTDLDKVNKANISLKITSDFMEAVKNGETYMTEFHSDTGEVIKEEVDAQEIFSLIAEVNWDYAEPGMLFWDRIEEWNIMSEDPEFEYAGTNPCFTGDMELLTTDGYKKIENLEDQEVDLINKDGDISQGKVWCSGKKDTVKLRLSNGKNIKCTPDHTFMTINEEEVEAKDLKGRKIMPKTSFESNKFDDLFIKLGFIQGDGNLTDLNNASKNGIAVNIGEDDEDIRELFEDENITQQKRYREVYLKGFNSLLDEYGFQSKILPERGLPSTYEDWTKTEKASFLQGCFSANGSVISGYRVNYKTTSRKLAEQLVDTLRNDFDIESYITTNKPRTIEFDNGEYECRESYDVNISQFDSLQKFHNKIGFYHSYKQDSLQELLISRAPKVTSIKDNGKKKVYDFTEPITNWGIIEGFVAHNCAEEPLPFFKRAIN